MAISHRSSRGQLKTRFRRRGFVLSVSSLSFFASVRPTPRSSRMSRTPRFHVSRSIHDDFQKGGSYTWKVGARHAAPWTSHACVGGSKSGHPEGDRGIRKDTGPVSSPVTVDQ